MAYDFSKVASEAGRVANASENSAQNNKYKLVYPGEGKIKFRLLFNPKSGLIGRLITRHNIEGKKVLCAGTYSHRDDCPICKILKDIQNMGVTYPRDYNGKTRGLFYAQFVSADYEVASGNLKKGDIFLLMVPYTIYKEIMKWVADFSSDASIMNKVFGVHEGLAQVIEKGKEATDWSFRPDPYVTLESAPDDEKFAQMLEGIDSLYECMGFHEKITSEEVALMNTTAQGLRDTFMGSQSPTQYGYQPPVPPAESMPQPTPAPMTQDAPKSAPAPQTPGGTDTPKCYGTYVNPDDPKNKEDASLRAKITMCKYCPVSATCKDASIPF